MSIVVSQISKSTRKNLQRVALGLIVLMHLGCAGDSCNSSGSTSIQNSAAVRVINVTNVPIDALFANVSNGTNIQSGQFSCYQNKQGDAGTSIPLVIKNHSTGAVLNSSASLVIRNALEIEDYVVYGSGSNVNVAQVSETRVTGLGAYTEVVDGVSANTVFDLKRKDLDTGLVTDYGQLGPALATGPRGRIHVTQQAWGSRTSANIEYDLYDGTSLVSSVKATLQKDTEYQVVFSDASTGGIVGSVFAADDAGCIQPGSGSGGTLADVMNAMPASTEAEVNANVGSVFFGGLTYGALSGNATIPTGQQPITFAHISSGGFLTTSSTFDSAHRYGIVGVGDQQDGFNVIIHPFDPAVTPASGHAFMTIYHGIKGLTETTDFYVVPTGMTVSNTPYTWKGAAPLTSKTLDITAPVGGYTNFQIVATEPNQPAAVVASANGRVKDQWSQYDVLVSPPNVQATFAISNEGTTQTIKRK